MDFLITAYFSQAASCFSHDLQPDPCVPVTWLSVNERIGAEVHLESIGVFSCWVKLRSSSYLSSRHYLDRVEQLDMFIVIILICHEHSAIFFLNSISTTSA